MHGVLCCSREDVVTKATKLTKKSHMALRAQRVTKSLCELRVPGDLCVEMSPATLQAFSYARGKVRAVRRTSSMNRRTTAPVSPRRVASSNGARSRPPPRNGR